MVRLITQLKRTWVELLILIGIGTALFLMPPIEKQGLELLLFKVLLFSASQLHAHILRIWMFPYIDFSDANFSGNNHQKIMTVAIHVTAAYVYSVGG